MPQFHCSAILFDLDGVLIDSTASVSRQYRAWSLENGLDPEFVLRNAHGVRTVEVIQRVAPHLDPEVETLKIEKREVADHAGVTAIPGAPELTRFLPRERWGVIWLQVGCTLAASNCQKFSLPRKTCNAESQIQSRI